MVLHEATKGVESADFLDTIVQHGGMAGKWANSALPMTELHIIKSEGGFQYALLLPPSAEHVSWMHAHLIGTRLQPALHTAGKLL